MSGLKNTIEIFLRPSPDISINGTQNVWFFMDVDWGYHDLGNLHLFSRGRSLEAAVSSVAGPGP